MNKLSFYGALLCMLLLLGMSIHHGSAEDVLFFLYLIFSLSVYTTVRLAAEWIPAAAWTAVNAVAGIYICKYLYTAQKDTWLALAVFVAVWTVTSGAACMKKYKK